ncbi:MAG: S49 family peptidase [Pseudomonadota bacterium]
MALLINSPGGSPTQSALIAARIRRLAAEKNVPVLAFCEDIAASGGYWLATAGDEIFADDNSIIGSIGVIYAGFGFHALLDRQGIERRVHTAGRSKSMLDPFRPEKEEDVARIKQLQGVIHDNFIDQVKSRRGDRLTSDDDLFTGEVWVGRQAQDVGLIDGIGHLVPVIKDRYGDDIRFNLVARKRGLLQRLRSGGAVEVLTADMLSGAVNAVEERALWARYGL